MIQDTKVWEYYSYEPKMRKKYGSKRSGRIYVVAGSPDEARQIIRELYEQAGLKPSEKNIPVSESHLVKQAFRLIY